MFPKCKTSVWKQCHSKCNRLRQPMYILSLKFDYFKFDKKTTNPYFSNQHVNIASSIQKSITYLETHMWILHILVADTFKAKVFEEPIPKCNIFIWKMPFEIQATTKTNLPTQMHVLHVWSKNLTPIFPPICEYCKFSPMHI